MKNYLPDTPKEYAYIGSAIGRLGSAISGILIFQADPKWILISVGLTWVGFEVNGYFKLQDDENTPPA